MFCFLSPFSCVSSGYSCIHTVYGTSRNSVLHTAMHRTLVWRPRPCTYPVCWVTPYLTKMINLFIRCRTAIADVVNCRYLGTCTCTRPRPSTVLASAWCLVPGSTNLTGNSSHPFSHPRDLRPRIGYVCEFPCCLACAAIENLLHGGACARPRGWPGRPT
jgi:hypothetical protein